MSNFEYIEKDGKLYLSIGQGRILVRWKRRWVPASETINTEPVVEDETLDLSTTDDVDEDENTVILNRETVEDNTIIL